MKSSRIHLIKADITKLEVDAIVNAANRTLLGGGGVDGAIHRAAGSQLLEACRTLNGCDTGSAKITKGYNLPAKYVIHAVGPVWHGGDNHEDELLKSCYSTSLKLAAEKGCNSIAFSNISTGVYHFPKRRAAHNTFEIVNKYVKENSLPKTIYFVCFDEENYQIYKELIEESEK